MSAAHYFYRRCQELGLPLIIVTRHCAYGCPIPRAAFVTTADTGHCVATNILKTQENGIDELWRKVKCPLGHPGREKLPDRCTLDWFDNRFCGGNLAQETSGKKTQEDIDNKFGKKSQSLPDSISHMVTQVMMYDPLTLLAALPWYRERYFKVTPHVVKGTTHLIVGISRDNNGIRDKDGLQRCFASLFHRGIVNSLECSRVVVKAAQAMEKKKKEGSKDSHENS